MPLLAPCPPAAYLSGKTFVEDTPLMRALRQEKRRRRIRRSRARHDLHREDLDVDIVRAG